jgi:glutaredoxin 3
MQVIVWSKTPCPLCEQAKSLLKLKGIEFEERNITHGAWTKEQLLESVPGAKSVPQIFIDEQYIGGLKDLNEFLENLEGR